MSVKNELDSFFDRFLKAYQKTMDGLPKCPRNKSADQAVYVGAPDVSHIQEERLRFIYQCGARHVLFEEVLALVA